MRRSLFTGEAERSAFLNRLVTGTRDILRSNQGLSEHSNYHEFCRLLGRLKTNYQLSELARPLYCPLIPCPGPLPAVSVLARLVSQGCIISSPLQCMFPSELGYVEAGGWHCFVNAGSMAHGPQQWTSPQRALQY